MVARGTGVSAQRLHQIFAETQGENFGAFVRRARLEHAVGLMRAFPSWSCTRIAHEAGYSESSDFTRTFSRSFGMPPSKWDRVKPLNRLAKNAPGGCDANEDDCPVGFPDQYSGPFALPKLSERQQQTCAVLSVQEPTAPGNLADAFARLESWLGDAGQLRDDRQFMGLSYDSTLDTPVDVMQFELAYPIDRDCDGCEDISIRTLPPCQCAVLPCRGGVGDFVAAWDFLLRGFLPASEWRQGPGPQIEVYYNDPRKHDMQYWDMDCVLPIEHA
ncbi:MAG: AraC family transcriptional regulator [Pseudomonadota bacterium]